MWAMMQKLRIWVGSIRPSNVKGREALLPRRTVYPTRHLRDSSQPAAAANSASNCSSKGKTGPSMTHQSRNSAFPLGPIRGERSTHCGVRPVEEGAERIFLTTLRVTAEFRD